MQRRSLLKLGAALALTPSLSRALTPGVAPNLADTLVFSAASDRAGGHFVCGQYLDGTLGFALPVPERAHACQLHPHQAVVAFFARRPGHQVHIVDSELGERLHTIDSAPGYHFYGHGVFSADGDWLYTTENDFGQGRGVIGIYAVQDHYRRVGEWDLQGIGPHELAWLPDRKTLAVALGGIHTATDQSRAKLNLDSMQPALLLVDSANGAIQGRWQPPHHQLSLRHLAVSAGGEVIVGAQFEGAIEHQHPLVFRLSGGAFHALTATVEDWRKQQHYIASVAVDSQQHFALTTSPRGGIATLWDLRRGAVASHHALPDVAGARWSHAANGFLLSNGYGEMTLLKPDSPETLENLIMQTHLRWDNHLMVSA